jgi:hypothetical protein
VTLEKGAFRFWKGLEGSGRVWKGLEGYERVKDDSRTMFDKSDLE